MVVPRPTLPGLRRITFNMPCLMLLSDSENLDTLAGGGLPDTDTDGEDAGAAEMDDVTEDAGGTEEEGPPSAAVTNSSLGGGPASGLTAG